MNIYFAHKLELAPNIWELFFEADRPVFFKAGQYASFHLPSVQSDPRGSNRVFTLTSLPHTTILSFIMKTNESVSEYKERLLNLRQGELVHMHQPLGDFILPSSSHNGLLLIAGGIGIASYVSMAQTLQSGSVSAVNMLYGISSRDQDIASRITGSNASIPIRKYISPHRITIKEITSCYAPGMHIYVSGSQRFTMGIVDSLSQHSIPKQYIHFDYYDGYTET